MKIQLTDVTLSRIVELIITVIILVFLVVKLIVLKDVIDISVLYTTFKP